MRAYLEQSEDSVLADVDVEAQVFFAASVCPEAAENLHSQRMHFSEVVDL